MDITLLDQNFDVIGDPVRGRASLIYEDAWEENGTMTLVLPHARFADVKEAAWLHLDDLHVYEKETDLDDDDAGDCKFTGSCLNVLFDRIVIKDDERLQGRLEERVRYLINKYAMTGSQKVPSLVLEEDQGYKRAIDANVKSGDTLNDFLYAALPLRGFSYRLHYSLSLGVIVFELLLGKDRTQDQDVNPQVLFSTGVEIAKSSYKKSTKDQRNFALVRNGDKDNPIVVEVDLSHGEPVRALAVSGRDVTPDPDSVNMFVMVGRSGYIGTSTDGKAFTARTSGTTKDFWSSEYRNGKYIVGAADGVISKSINGLDWAAIASGSSYAIEGVTYLDGMYWLFTSGGSVLYSYDATTFAPALTAGHGKIVNAVSTPRGLFAFSSGAASLLKLRSSDGVDWLETVVSIAGDPTSVAVLRTCYEYGKVVAAGYWYNGMTYKPLVIRSLDFGVTETVHVVESLSGHRFLDAAAGLGLFVAVGQPNIIAWSTDGVVWTECTPETEIDYIAVAFDGTSFYAYGYSTRKVAISSDGKNFTVYDITGVTQNVDAVCYGFSSYIASLYEQGVLALQKATSVEVLDGDVNPALAPVYGVDYNIGDVGDVVDPKRGLLSTKRILKVQHINEPDETAVVPKFGKDFPSLRQYIAKEINKNA